MDLNAVRRELSLRALDAVLRIADLHQRIEAVPNDVGLPIL